MWEVERKQRVEEFLEGCEKIPRKQIEQKFEMLEAYAEQASAPLVKQLEGKIWYLRTEVHNHGLYRIFYYRRGNTAVTFEAHKKGGQKLPHHVRERVIERYKAITGEKP